jgi:hypothetical protein
MIFKTNILGIEFICRTTGWRSYGGEEFIQTSILYEYKEIYILL